MTEPAPRQVLYALVSAGFLGVVIVLTIGSSRLVPGWWTGVMVGAIALAAVWIGFNWRRTGLALLVSIVLFVVWATGTLALAP